MVHFVALLQAAQDGDGVFHRGLADGDRLEAPLERGILLDVLAIFVERGGADGAQLAARQRGLEHVGGVHGAFGGAGAHQGVQFVDEENDLALGFGHFLQQSLQAVFEFAAIFCSGDQRGQIERHDPLGLQNFRHVAGDDALRQAFDNGGLAHAGLADQHGIVFRAARQNLHHAANFLVAADHRIEFAAARQLGQVAPILFDGAKGRFRILRGNAMAAANGGHGLQDGVVRRPVAHEELARGVAVRRGDGQQNVLGRNVVVLQALRFVEGALENFVGSFAQKLIGDARHLGQALDLLLDFARERGRRDSQLFKQRRHNAVALRDERPKQMQRLDLLLARAPAHLLGGLQGLLSLHREFVKTQHGVDFLTLPGVPKGHKICEPWPMESGPTYYD